MSGVIVISETLEGVPVWKIADGAFVGQTKLTSVSLPESVCENSVLFVSLTFEMIQRRNVDGGKFATNFSPSLVDYKTADWV